MLLGTYQPVGGKIEKLQINRPLHALLFKITISGGLASAEEFFSPDLKINVSLQDNRNSARTNLIPSLPLAQLSEFSTRKEGFCLGHFYTLPDKGAVGDLCQRVLLTPNGNIDLSGDKYLLVDLLGLSDNVDKVEVYGFEHDTYSAFNIKYDKVSIPKGLSREIFRNDGGANAMILPVDGFDEVQISYVGGVTVTRTLFELQYDTCLNNDLIAAFFSEKGVIASALYGYQSGLIVDMSGVEKIEVVRDSAGLSDQDFTAILVKSTVDNLTSYTANRLLGNSPARAINTDGTYTLKGAEIMRYNNVLSDSSSRVPVELVRRDMASISK
ncbi:hypothetical protein D0T49_03085 [Paludibacter sp. 221]|uniref:hypothetical protein n=1 Tax=Paludibacter sp. 221 TaxID=2302939 RepID=UPI0013D70E30|nr:hypothetical protein [Paludibacter sp. 221]NDV46024.1 hypothetical protein [Paludibacter sp. 221]